MSEFSTAQRRFREATVIACDVPPYYNYQVGYGRTSASIQDNADVVLSKIVRIDFADHDFLIFGIVNGLNDEDGKPLTNALAICEPDIDEPATGFLCNVSFTKDISVYDEVLAKLRTIE